MLYRYPHGKSRHTKGFYTNCRLLELNYILNFYSVVVLHVPAALRRLVDLDLDLKFRSTRAVAYTLVPRGATAKSCMAGVRFLKTKNVCVCFLRGSAATQRELH